MADALKAWRLLVNLVYAFDSVGERGERLSSVRVDTKKFSNSGLFASVFPKGVADVLSKLWAGGNDHRFGRVDRTMKLEVCRCEPELACIGDKEMYPVRGSNALELHVVNIKFEWYMAVDGAV